MNRKVVTGMMFALLLVPIVSILVVPARCFTYSPSTPRVNETVTFYASSSSPLYIWNFGDGNTTSTTYPIVTHKYAMAGDYLVILTYAFLNWTVIDTENLWISIYGRTPVILVHGYHSGPSTWNTLIPYLEQQGYVLNENLFTIDLAPGLEPANGDIKTYAKRLSAKIKEIQAGKVDIIAHSMGGLVSRYYIEKCDGDHKVNKLIMLGTPNHGSELLAGRWFITLMAILQDSWWMLGDVLLGKASVQMTPGSSFLKSLGYTGKTSYYTIAGTKEFPLISLIISLILKGSNDGLVRVASVELEGVPSQNQHRKYLNHFGYHTQKKGIDQIIEILNDDPIVETQFMSPPMQTQQENQTLMEAPMVSGEISPEEQKHHEILVSAATEVTFALAWLEGNLGLVLTTPNGTIINSSVAESNPNITHYSSENITIKGYNIKNPEIGIWNASITAVNVSEAEKYSLMTFLETNITLSFPLQKSQYNPNEPINVKAKLTKGAEAITNATVTAKVQRPDRTIENVTLYDDGLHNDNQTNDGAYANTYTNTSLWGTYEIVVTATGTTDTDQFAREVFTTVWVELYPDLTLNKSDIYFSNENPCHGETVTINATIHNDGEADANNASILFYDGNHLNGILIGEDTINVTAGKTRRASIQWTATFGTHEIYVLISPYEEFLEKNYTNNVAFKSFLVVKNWAPIIIDPNGYPVADLAVYNGNLWATSDSMLYRYNGSSWKGIQAPTYVFSLEAYQDTLVVGGKGGLYTHNGTNFTQVFTVPNYIKPLGLYDTTLYAGTVLDNPPTLYYCNGSVDNQADWHIDTAFSSILDFPSPFSSIDSFEVYKDEMYVASGNTVYSFNGTDWTIVGTFSDTYAFLDMKVYNDELYLATRDQGWRKPIYEGGTGFSGRVIEFDESNWTAVLDHDYWIYSLETYGGKLYAGTANKIFTYNGTDWETSFHTEEGAYYAISLETYDGKTYAGMGNGYILVDPIFETTPNQVVPEFPSFMILPVLMIVTLLGAIIARKKTITP